MIRAENVQKTFYRGGRPVEVLRGVNLEIRKGERVAVVGVSGVGKSTLLHILGTLERPTAGRVLFDGRDVAAESEEQLAQFRNTHLGFVFQFHHLLPEFTALENVLLPALIAGKSRPEAGEHAREILTRLGLAARLDHRPAELSGGEQQRVALARAIVLSPPVLLADEPTGNLDPRTGEDIQEELVRLNESLGVTLLIVTHSPHLSSRMHRAVTLVDGRIEEVRPGAALS